MPNIKKKIGFIGQGWVGKNYADVFEKLGFNVVRYSQEPLYVKNKDKISLCDIVFIAVPTPTTVRGFDDSIVRKVVKLVGKGKIAVIKSTILPGTTASIQKENPKIFVMHSPEFLTESTAVHDAANPERNIIGVPKMTKKYTEKAKIVKSVLPKAPYELICSSEEAEFIKYSGNCWLYFKVVFTNILYDTSSSLDLSWDVIRDALSADSRIGKTHLDPIHKSGRGAGGHCFIKDFASFRKFYEKMVGDKKGIDALKFVEIKNIELLKKSNKDLGLLKSVYGKNF
ncbi:MAG: hypothetical protein HQ402_01690 [Parcubacteria group bacterium]|nr:hypothetical protein [Parcubacteria group bacterium]